MLLVQMGFSLFSMHFDKSSQVLLEVYPAFRFSIWIGFHMERSVHLLCTCLLFEVATLSECGFKFAVISLYV